MDAEKVGEPRSPFEDATGRGPVSDAMVTKVARLAERSLATVRAALNRAPLHAPWSANAVVYIGAATSSNLGDRVVFEAARHLVSNRALIPAEGAGRERRLAWVGLSGAGLFSAGVLGGGTLINDYSRAVVEVLLDAGVPMFALGTGAGSAGWSISEDIDLRPWATLLNRFQHVGVRGPLSRAALEKVGTRNVEVVGDLALTYAEVDDPRRKRSRRVMINAIEPGPRERWNPALPDALRATLRKLAGQGWEVLPFAMHPRDVHALNALLRNSGIRCEAPVYPSSPLDVIRLAATSRLVISMRLHGAILGVCGGAATVPLSYRNKCDDFARSVDLEATVLSLMQDGDVDDLETALAERMSRAEDCRDRVIERAVGLGATLRERAKPLLEP